MSRTGPRLESYWKDFLDAFWRKVVQFLDFDPVEVEGWGSEWFRVRYRGPVAACADPRSSVPWGPVLERRALSGRCALGGSNFSLSLSLPFSVLVRQFVHLLLHCSGKCVALLFECDVLYWCVPKNCNVLLYVTFVTRCSQYWTNSVKAVGVCC